MIRDLSGAFVNGIRMEPLDRFGYSRVQTLSARGGDAGEQRLSHKFMSKGKWPLRPLGARDDHPHLLHFLDDGEEFVNMNLADRSQKLKAKTAPDHRSSQQHPLFVLVAPLQAAADNQPHVFRDIVLVELDFSTEFTGRVEEFSPFDQVTVYLLDEEWVSLAFLKDGVQQALRRPALA